MKIDILVAEIGSTTTVVNAFNNINTNKPVFLGQGFSETTVNDVTDGLAKAIKDLEKNLGTDQLDVKEIFASSSSAGGLIMSVHGLVHDMTVKAAKEAALGAGANIKMITSGILSKLNLTKIKELKPNIIMLAGGVNYGEANTALTNAKEIAKLKLNTPVIYAGNIAIQDEIKEIFKQNDQDKYLYLTNNVYPKIDVLDVSEARKIIQEVFEENITKAKGMEKVRNIVNGTIIPTPGAVMQASLLLQAHLGNLLTIDVGGATTDIHSVTTDSIEVATNIINPEPFSKRTVEGDLGVFVNKDNLVKLVGFDKLTKLTNLSEKELNHLLDNYKEIPTFNQVGLVGVLTEEAFNVALSRHAGKFHITYTASGKKRIPEGKDLTEVKYLIATGGALTRLKNNKQIIQNVLNKTSDLLLRPKATTKILIDTNYIMASLGVLSKKYPEAALKLLKESLEIGE